MKLSVEEANVLMRGNAGSLNLRGTDITALPEGLTVGGWLDLRGTGVTVLPEGLTVGGWLDLRGTGVTVFPEGLTVGGSLDLSGTGVTALPEGLTVGGWLDLSGTGVTVLPEGLTVGGSLDLRGTGVTVLPEGLTVGGWLDLSGTGVTALPEGLTVGGSLYLSGTGISIKNHQVKKLRNGDYKEGCYLYCDGILTHVKRRKTVNRYTYFFGRIPGKNVVFDGKNYAHCKDFHDGIQDLIFKSASDRGADQYKGISLDKEMDVDDLVTMYRIITGACRQGSQSFVDKLGDKLKPRYTIREAISMTKGQYGWEHFSEFFDGS